MACNFFSGGVYCTADAMINLRPYGSSVWMEWHNYLGPSFFRGKHSNSDMQAGRKTWKAFELWYEQSGMKEQHAELFKHEREINGVEGLEI